MTTGQGRPPNPSTRENERRRNRHAYLRKLAREGFPGAADELRAFRAGWAIIFRERALAAESMEGEDYWQTRYERWAELARRPGI